MVNTWKIILATIVIFGAGVVTGGLLVSHSDRVRGPRPRPQPTTGAPPWFVRDFEANIDQRRVEFLLRATRELKLTADQRQRIDKVVQESQERTRQLWDQVTPQMRKELTDTKDKILAVLTPEQQTRFQELLKQPPRERRPDEPEKSGYRGRDPSRPFPPDKGPRPTNPPQSQPPRNSSAD